MRQSAITSTQSSSHCWKAANSFDSIFSLNCFEIRWGKFRSVEEIFFGRTIAACSGKVEPSSNSIRLTSGSSKEYALCSTTFELVIVEEWTELDIVGRSQVLEGSPSCAWFGVERIVDTTSCWLGDSSAVAIDVPLSFCGLLSFWGPLTDSLLNFWLVECIVLLYLCGIWSCSDVEVSGGKQDVVLKNLFTFTDPFPTLAIADLPLRRLPILQHSWAQLDG